MQPLALFPGDTSAGARAVSGDGAVILGGGGSGSVSHVLLWVGGSVQYVGGLPGSNYSGGWSITQDGSVIFGVSQFPSGGPAHAFRLTRATGVMEDIGIPDGFTYLNLWGTNGSGTLLIALAIVNSSQPSRPYVWDSTFGWVEVGAYLAAQGLDLTGWSSLSAAGVSTDGKILCGGGFHNGVGESWMADLHICRADFNRSGNLSTQDIFDFLNAWFAGSAAADFNGTSGLTEQDIFDFLNAWFSGCP
jgi:hypothetical protein